jgi:hypothetical protein
LYLYTNVLRWFMRMKIVVVDSSIGFTNKLKNNITL